MKSLPSILLVFAVTLFYVSCDKEDEQMQIITYEEQLITQIIDATSLDAVSIDDVPAAIYSYVHQNHMPLEIEAVFQSGPYGFEVFLENGISLYFDSHGRHINNNGPLRHHRRDEQLIRRIINASFIEGVTVDGLPAAIYNYVHQSHMPLEIEIVFRAGPFGFEVFLENGLCLYFDGHGRHLNHNGLHGDFDNHHGGGDLGLNFCLVGDTLSIVDLPQPATNYISTNHSDATIMTFVLKPSGRLAVEINNGDILIFNSEGDFIHDCDLQGAGGHGHMHGSVFSHGWSCEPDETMIGGGHGNHGGMGMGGHHGGMGMGGHQDNMDMLHGSNEPCWGGTGISIDDCPVAINNYLMVNHSDATIFHAMRTFSNSYFVRLSDCTRLIFDENGNILFASGD